MKIIVGNWKMNGDAVLAESFVNALNAFECANKIIICPPAELIGCFKSFKHHVGAQNCYCEDRGAFTGEISALSLRQLGCEYVILGHSERRNLFNETSELIFEKWKNALKNELTPIVCVGEKNQKSWEEELETQLRIFFGQDMSTTVVAYEPVWSIGTGEIPTIDGIARSLKFIKTMFGETATLYGGSVNTRNYRSILDQNIVDGVLIGGASLKLTEFSEICGYKTI